MLANKIDPNIRNFDKHVGCYYTEERFVTVNWEGIPRHLDLDTLDRYIFTVDAENEIVSDWESWDYNLERIAEEYD